MTSASTLSLDRLQGLAGQRCPRTRIQTPHPQAGAPQGPPTLPGSGSGGSQAARLRPHADQSENEVSGRKGGESPMMQVARFHKNLTISGSTRKERAFHAVGRTFGLLWGALAHRMLLILA